MKTKVIGKHIPAAGTRQIGRAGCSAVANETGRYIRPIMLIRVERTGKDQRDSEFVHAEDVAVFDGKLA